MEADRQEGAKMIHKFRAWHKGTFYYSHHDGHPGYLDLYNGQWEIRTVYENGDHGGDIEISDEDVEQWSGLLDKSSIEIYEGDIVNYALRPGKEEYIEVIDDIRYLSIWVEVSPFEGSYNEVIGNIHENPDLLK